MVRCETPAACASWGWVRFMSTRCCWPRRRVPPAWSFPASSQQAS
jgi:hypothetical protein